MIIGHGTIYIYTCLGEINSEALENMIGLWIFFFVSFVNGDLVMEMNENYRIISILNKFNYLFVTDIFYERKNRNYFRTCKL